MFKELSIHEEQELQLDVLKMFSEICQSEKLVYFLAYGTLLGAVRDHGFIDWDDDVDIWMPRKDYDKFAEAYYKYQRTEYFLQTYKTDPKCASPEMMRICINGTYKWPSGCEKEKFNTGIYFDIFPLDYGHGNDQDYADLKLSTELHKKIWSTLPIKRNNAIKTVIHRIHASVLPRKKYSFEYNSLIKKHLNCESDTLLVFASSFAGLSRSYFNKSFFNDVVWVDFEHISLPIPTGYDELLKYMYGDDYMVPKQTKPSRNKAYIIV